MLVFYSGVLWAEGRWRWCELLYPRRIMICIILDRLYQYLYMNIDIKLYIFYI